MTGKERVLMSLAHEQPDRVPMDLGGRQTTLSLIAYDRLKEHLGMGDLPTRIMSHIWQTSFIAEEILELFQIDTRHVRPKSTSTQSDTRFEEGEEFADQWGIKRRISGGYANFVVPHLLENADFDEIDQFAFPDPAKVYDYTGLARQAKKLHEEGKYAVVGCMGSPGSTYEQCWYLRGLSTFLVDLMKNKDGAHRLMTRMLEDRKRQVDLFCAEVGPYLDVIQLADDLGSQDSTIMSVPTYREMVKPYQAALVEHIKKQTSARIYLHSCGAVAPLIEDFIEIGIDILNPFQVTARGMNTTDVKDRFGKNIAFWGGIDTFQILPNGTVAEVKKEINRVITDMAPGGGYVMGSVHNMQNDVPPENVEAMFTEALRIQ